MPVACPIGRSIAVIEDLDEIQEDLDSRMPDFAALFPVRSCDRDHADEVLLQGLVPAIRQGVCLRRTSPRRPRPR